MKKILAPVLCMLAGATVAGWNVASVEAFLQFKKEFDNLYVKEETANEAEKTLKEAVATEKCGVCHTGPQGKDKKIRNTYGQAIEKLIPDPTNKAAMDALKNKPTDIKELLEKAAKEPSDPKNPQSPTFGQLIEQGKLPGK